MIFSVTPLGNLGNRIIQYLAASSVAKQVFDDVRINCELPEYGLLFDKLLHEKLINDKNTIFVTDAQFGNPSWLANIVSLRGKNVIFRGFFLNSQSIGTPEQHRNGLIKRTPLDIDPFEDDELVLNIRSGEITKAPVYWYPLTPVEFYQELIHTRKLRPVLLGQIDDSEYCSKLLEAFPSARIVPSAGPVVDFNRLLHTKRVCISVSTFSWVGAFLSNAVEIHYPLLGFLHPFCLNQELNNLDVDLAPVDDARYKFHIFPVLHAEPEHQYLEMTRKLSPISHAVDVEFVKYIRNLKESGASINLRDYWEYLRDYPDAAWSVHYGRQLSAHEHYEKVGKDHGYVIEKAPPRPDFALLSRNQPATQSSTSPWSRKYSPAEDAAGAVDGVIDGQYSFCTSKEYQPWWRVDLQDTCEIFEIRLFNRTDNQAVANRANHLLVESSQNDATYEEIFTYESKQPFGGVDGNPLIIRLEIPSIGRFLRVRLLAEDCLHLVQVEVFGRRIEHDAVDKPAPVIAHSH